MAPIPDAVIAGGGVIGRAAAWRAAAAGLSVTVVDPGHGDAASLVAAGMLAPVSESIFGEEALLALNLLAIRRFPAFAAELEAAAGRDVGLRREGTLAVAYDPGDLAALQRLIAFRRSAGLDAAGLDGRACRALEPFLAPEVRGGALFAGEASVDNRRYTAALGEAMRTAGARLVRGRVTEVLAAGGRASGVRLDGGATIAAGAVVLAAGWETARITGPPGGPPPVRPVKGQLLRLRHPPGMPPVLSHTVRATVRGMDLYLVPRAGGELIVGATSEELGADRSVTAGAVYGLLRDAHRLLPVVSELVLAETCAGLRPGTPDNGPAVGESGLPGLLLATGHYRNGILLSAVTADAVAALLAGGCPAAEWAPFGPRRFATGVGGGVSRCG